MPKSRLLYVLHFYHNRGGVEEHVRALAQHLAHEFEVYIVAPENGRLIVVRDEKIVRSYTSEKIPWPITPYRHEKTEVAVTRLLDDISPDLIHIQHLLHWPVSTAEQLLNRNVPVLLTLHDYFLLSPYYTLQGAPSIQAAFEKEYSAHIFQTDITEYLKRRVTIFGEVLKRCCRFICPSHALARDLSPILNFPYEVIEHGIAPFSPLALTAGAEKRFGFLGSKLPQKGWMELLKAFQILRLEMKDIELHFYGGGHEAPVASPGVTFYPAYAPSDLPKIMSEFSIGVIPSLFRETYCYVLSELWMAGKPVAASEIGSLRERVQEGITGKFFQPGNIQAMVDTLRWFVTTSQWQDWKIPRPRLLESMIEDYRFLYRSLV